jgi:crotonobetainyl-CoA:carnitine CoA-transferase CaiB-like acyl-CoA transferase
LAPYVDLAGDDRFVGADARRKNARALIDTLSKAFATKSAMEWEHELLAADVACVAVTTTSIEDMLFDDTFGRASGYVVDVVHPTFDEHPRLAPYIRFSRSATQALRAVTTGEQTDKILGELGKTADEIADLRARSVVG